MLLFNTICQKLLTFTINTGGVALSKIIIPSCNLLRALCRRNNTAVSTLKEQRVAKFLSDNSFAMFITEDEGKLNISHINLILDSYENKPVLLGHVSNANIQSKQLHDNPRAVAIFSTPQNVQQRKAQQESDILLVQTTGTVQVIREDKSLKLMLEKLISKYESSKSPRWSIDWNDKRFSEQIRGITGFQLINNHAEVIRGGQSVYETVVQRPSTNSITPFPLFIPSSFKENNSQVLLELIKEYPFCAIIVLTSENLRVLHTNLFVEQHTKNLSKENLVLKTVLEKKMVKLEEGEYNIIAVFRGPHSYVSPSWYKTPYSVPTWNYAVVHVHGVLKITHVGEDVQFKVAATHLDGKFKFNQNRILEDRIGVIKGLKESRIYSDEAKVAKLMESQVHGCPLGLNK